jgi:PRTRC genetic system protein C
MALQVTQLKRKFVLDNDGDEKPLSDPSSAMTPQEVLKHYLPIYPELTNARVEGPRVEAGQAVYKLTTEAGTHG